MLGKLGYYINLLAMETENIRMKKILLNILLCIALLFSIMGLYVSLSLKDDVLKTNSNASSSKGLYSVSVGLFENSISEIDDRISALEVIIQNLDQKISLIDNSRVHLNTVNLRVEENTDNSLKYPKDVTIESTNYNAYNIKPGDTFSKLAKDNGISLNSIIRANSHLDPQALKIGQEIIIPNQ